MAQTFNLDDNSTVEINFYQLGATSPTRLLVKMGTGQQVTVDETSVAGQVDVKFNGTQNAIEYA